MRREFERFFCDILRNAPTSGPAAHGLAGEGVASYSCLREPVADGRKPEGHEAAQQAEEQEGRASTPAGRPKAA